VRSFGTALVAKGASGLGVPPIRGYDAIKEDPKNLNTNERPSEGFQGQAKARESMGGRGEGCWKCLKPLLTTREQQV